MIQRRTPLKRTGIKRPTYEEALAKAKAKQEKAKLQPVKIKKRKPPRKLEDKTALEIRKEADKWFSRYIRLRDSQHRGDGWYGTCVTCSKHGLVMDNAGKWANGWNAGHFVTRGKLVVRFNEKNVHLQCAYRCNNMKSGEYEKHRIAINHMYEKNTAEQLEQYARDNQYHKLFKHELLELVETYKSKVYAIMYKELGNDKETR